MGKINWSRVVLGGLLATVVLTALFGIICVRSTRIFFSILTMALSQVLWSLAYKFFWVTGGTDGIRVPTPSLLAGMVDATKLSYGGKVVTYYYYVLFFFFLSVGLMWLIVHSPFGTALQAIRDNETRAAFVGVRVQRSRWLAFLVSGIFTGLAGILWVPLNGLTTPDILVWTFSGRIVFFTVLGGFRSFVGPILGAVVFNYLETYAISATVYWQFVLGAVLVMLVLVMPTGLVGLLSRLAYAVRRAT